MEAKQNKNHEKMQILQIKERRGTQIFTVISDIGSAGLGRLAVER